MYIKINEGRIFPCIPAFNHLGEYSHEEVCSLYEGILSKNSQILIIIQKKKILIGTGFRATIPALMIPMSLENAWRIARRWIAEEKA